jgi:hypothetical protein
MLNPPLTHHASKRMQQRGIPERVLPLLFEYGKEEYDHHGTMLLYFNKRARQRLAKAMPQDELKHIQRALNAYAVLDQNGAVVTVGHRTQRVNHN